MAKKKPKRIITEEERRKDRLERLEREQLWLAPAPEQSFLIGESVSIGSLKNCVVEEIIDCGMIYGISYLKDEGPGYNYWFWYDIHPSAEMRRKESFIQNKDIRIDFSNRWLESLLIKVFHFGVDFEPEYQRGFVWEHKDKVALIDSIFHNVDIGKFVFVERPFEPGKPDYEILDGKQRLSAIVDFYLNRFQYNGCYYNELSTADMNWFLRHNISVAECRNLTEQQKLQYFIMLNTTGKTVDEAHMDEVKKLYRKRSENN